MSRMRLFFRCIGEAVCARGLKAVMTLVPFGEAIYEIAEETYRRLKRCAKEGEQVAAVAATAAASPSEARAEAEAVVAEIAAQQSLPQEAQINLVSYLTQ